MTSLGMPPSLHLYVFTYQEANIIVQEFFTQLNLQPAPHPLLEVSGWGLNFSPVITGLSGDHSHPEAL